MTELQGNWLTYPSESRENGATVIVTLRTDVEKFRDNPRFKYRLTVDWPYQGDASGMPDEATSQLMEQATDLLAEAFRKDPVAVLTEISTGDNLRQWVFYTLSLAIFSKKINEALAPLPPLPLAFDAEEDPDWASHNDTAD